MKFPLIQERKTELRTEEIQALNYSAHAIEDFRKAEAEIRGVAPQSAQVYHRLIAMLQNSVKFILPNCCDLIDPREMGQAHLDLVRLPFPCVAFEVPWNKEEDGLEYVGDFKQTPATKRIALCWEPHPEYEVLPGMCSVLDIFPEGGVFVAPIYWTQEFNEWTVSLGGTFVPYVNEVRDLEMDKMEPATRIAIDAKLEAGLASEKSKHFRAEPFYLFPEMFEEAISTYGDQEKAYAQIILDSHDEVMVLVQACSVMNCANVTTSEIAAPAALNKKRMAKGKQPFFSYKILQLSEDKRPRSGAGSGGKHASPRMHLRRGHLRRLEKKVVWVRPSMINADSKRGAVVKDYLVPPKA